MPKKGSQPITARNGGFRPWIIPKRDTGWVRMMFWETPGISILLPLDANSSCQLHLNFISLSLSFISIPSASGGDYCYYCLFCVYALLCLSVLTRICLFTDSSLVISASWIQPCHKHTDTPGLDNTTPSTVNNYNRRDGFRRFRSSLL